MRHSATWEQSEEKYLIDNYRKLSNQALVERLQEINSAGIKRSVLSIKIKAQKMGLFKRIFWTNEEEEYLFSLLGEYHWSELVKVYNQWAKNNQSKPRNLQQIKNKVLQKKKSIRLNASTKYLTSLDLSYLLGCSRQTATRIFQKYQSELKVKGTLTKGTQSYASRVNVKKWLLNHLDIVEKYRDTLDLLWYSDIISGQ